jgi:hypothetical protein
MEEKKVITSNMTMQTFKAGAKFTAYGSGADMEYLPGKDVVSVYNGKSIRQIEVEQINVDFFVLSDSVGAYKPGQQIYFNFCELK